ncbi:MAG: M23 family metallopeptidase [Ferruginibacter sp.]
MFRSFPVFIILLAFYSCKTPTGVFSKKTLHEQYGEKLDKAGLRQTAIGNRWFEAAQTAIINPIAVPLPYKENGYFAADRPESTGLQFNAKRGELLTIEVSATPADKKFLFADLFSSVDGVTRYMQSIDTNSNLLRYNVKENTNFILRLQPEVLQSGSYILTITTGPSLAYPAPSATKNRIISVWGDGRDRGARKHEGVDISGTLRTPLLAIGDGYVSRVTENNLGGKVIFIRDANSNESWYYAHLDSQIATNGQRVRAGDIIGLMGNTGNARFTSPHLHFGIYTSSGAVDPLPYINPVAAAPRPVIASTAVLGKLMRIWESGAGLSFTWKRAKEKPVENTPVRITAATNNLYKAILPTGETRFIPAANLVSIQKKIRSLTLKAPAKLMEAPDEVSPVIQNLDTGAELDILGIYGEYRYVAAGTRSGWIKQ